MGLKLCGAISANGSQLTIFCVVRLGGETRELISASLKACQCLLGEPLKEEIIIFVHLWSDTDISFLPVPQQGVWVWQHNHLGSSVFIKPTLVL